MKKNLLSLALFILIGVLSRVIPHPWNFTGITAMALFAGLLAKENKFLFLAPLISLFISDLILGFHNTMIYTYLGFAVIGLISIQSYSKNISDVLKMGWNKQIFSILGLSVSGSIIFFIISNFGVWFSTGLYEKSVMGLAQCYIAGLPFLQNQLAGDAFYSLVFLVVLNLVTAQKAVEVKNI